MVKMCSYIFLIVKLTLYANIRSFASSCTAGFHGEKLSDG